MIHHGEATKGEGSSTPQGNRRAGVGVASADELGALPDGWRWLRISIPVDTTSPVDADEYARIAADAARMQIERMVSDA